VAFLIAGFIYREVRKDMQYGVLKTNDILLPLSTSCWYISCTWNMKGKGSQSSHPPGIVKIIISLLFH